MPASDTGSGWRRVGTAALPPWTLVVAAVVALALGATRALWAEAGDDVFLAQLMTACANCF
jgi:hypothetical protein